MTVTPSEATTLKAAKFKHLKSVLTYNCHLPDDFTVEQALRQRMFRDITEAEFETWGFVKNSITGQLATPFADGSRGFSIVLRHDSKIMPPAVVKAEVEKRIAAYLEETGLKRVGREEKRDITEDVKRRIARTALVKRDFIHAFYDAKAKLLFVSGSSKKRASLLTSDLVRAFGAVRFETVYFDGVSHGLTTRLEKHIDEQRALRNGYIESEEVVDPFEGFEVGGFCEVATPDGEVVRYAVDDLTDDDLSVLSNLRNGYKVTKIALDYGDDVDFVLDSNFRLSRIDFPPLELDEEEAEDAAYVFRSEAYYRVTVLSAITKKLTEMLKPADTQSAETTDEEVI